MNVVFVVVCPFPYGEASSIRALNLCHLLHDAGHRVHVISDYPSVSKAAVDFCTYEAVSCDKKNFFERNATAKKSVERVKNYCRAHSIDAILTNARFDRFNQLAAFCKKEGLKLFVENCEWYHPSSFKLGVLDLRYWKNQKMIQRDFRKADGFISISRLLHEHNRGFGIPSVRIPTIMDIDQIVPSETVREKEAITIVYTGNPGKSKEFLLPVIAALAEDELLRKKIQFHIYGPSRQRVLINIGQQESLLQQAGDSVVIHGKVPQDKMADIVKDADFALFLRPNRRSSNAGFPTKLGECMAVGTPAISNDTGDIGLYLKDGLNGFLLQDTTAASVSAVLHRILQLQLLERQTMRKHARITAEESFNYKKYITDIQKLLSEVFEQ